MTIRTNGQIIAGSDAGNQLNNPFSLLDYKFSEYEITNASWLRSNGQYNSGTTYADVYNLLLQIYNDTVTKAGVSVKLSTETYEDTDFVLNTSDTTFRLPLKVALASGKAVAGNGIALGLTDGTIITGLFNSSSVALAASTGNYGKDIGTTNDASTGPAIGKAIGITTDPTKSGIETSANDLYLYFYVGAVVQDASVIVAASVLTQIAELSFDYVVESKTPTAEDPTWYRVYKSGWVEQGGKCPTLSSTSWTNTTINLIRNFASSDYSVITGGVARHSNSTVVGFTITNQTTTTFDLYHIGANSGSANGDCYWEAKGQGA